MLTQILLLSALALLAGYIWHVRRSAPNKPQLTSRNATKASSTKAPRPVHRCVVIQPGLISCKAVLAYKGSRILMQDAPILPVQGCNEKECECKFLRYDDRRSGARRTKMKGAPQFTSESMNNKRYSKDRRNS